MIADSIAAIVIFGLASCSNKSPTHAPSAAIQDIPSDGMNLLVLQQDYFVNEGPSHRGDRFDNLTGHLMIACQQGLTLSRFEVLRLLGAPDYVWQDKSHSGFAYIYAASKYSYSYPNTSNVVAKTRATLILFDQNFLVSDVAFSGPDALDRNMWKPYSGLPQN